MSRLDTASTALIVIDVQKAFIEIRGEWTSAQ